jgi:hypothetical protein
MTCALLYMTTPLNDSVLCTHATPPATALLPLILLLLLLLLLVLLLLLLLSPNEIKLS